MGIVLGLGPTPDRLSRRSPEGILLELRKGDLETYSFFASRPRPMLGRPDFFPESPRASGESFSLLSDTEVFRSTLEGGMKTLRSVDTRLVPFNADPDPLDDRDGRLVAEIPNPMAALGVAAAPAAFSGDAPKALEALFSWMIVSF